MNVLITGSRGQLGSELCRCIERKKSEIAPLGKEWSATSIRAVDIDELDISDINIVRYFIKENCFDLVINCAAYTNVDGCETNQDVAIKANALGPRNLAVACEENGIKLIHISTDYVFSGKGTVPYREYDMCSPRSVYGKTKLLGEQYIRELCSRYFIIRTSWLYGYYGNNFVHTMKRLGESKSKISVVNDQRGNPTNAADLAHHILELALTDEYGIYHCTGNGECSWYEFACKIMELYNLDCVVEPCTTEEYPTPAERPSYSSLDNMMLRLTVGDKMRNWKDALKYFIEKERTVL